MMVSNCTALLDRPFDLKLDRWILTIDDSPAM